MSTGPERLFVSVEEAIDLIEQHLPPASSEVLPLDKASGRILMEDLAATEDLPRFANSAMDGFALREADLKGASKESPRSLPLAGEIAAGGDPAIPWPPGSCLRILTGAPAPADCEGVVPVEDCEEGDGVVHFHAELPREVRHLRPAGEDVQKGELLMENGRLLRPAEIALLAAQGVRELPCARLPRVALLATGNELADYRESPGPSGIRDSNRPALKAMLEAEGFQPELIGPAPDRKGALSDLLASALDEYDCLVTIGGISAGRYDLVGESLQALGARWIFHKVTQQPAKPLAFFQWKAKPVFCLPGNPVSSFLAAWFYLLPALKRMSGHRKTRPPEVLAVLEESLSGKPKKSFFARAHTRWDDGQFLSRPCPPHGSHILSSLGEANSFILLPPGQGELPPGSGVKLFFFHPDISQ